jgi:hypothetical protein
MRVNHVAAAAHNANMKRRIVTLEEDAVAGLWIGYRRPVL